MADNVNATAPELSAKQPDENVGSLSATQAEQGTLTGEEQQQQPDGTFTGKPRPEAKPWKGIDVKNFIDADNAADGVCEFLSGVWLEKAAGALVGYMDALDFVAQKWKFAKEAHKEDGMRGVFESFIGKDSLKNFQDDLKAAWKDIKGPEKKKEEKQTEEPKKEGPKKEEPKKQTEEPKKEGPKKEEPKKQTEEPKKEGPKKEGPKKKKKRNKTKGGKKTTRNKKKNKNKTKTATKAKTEKKTLQQRGKDAQNRKKTKANKTKAGQLVNRKRAQKRDSLRSLNSAQKAIRNRNNRAKSRTNNRTMARSGGRS